MFFIPAASPKSSTWPVSANGNWKSHAEKHHISSHTQWLCYKQHGFWKTRKPFFSWMRNSWANDQNSTLLSEGLKMFEWLLGQYWSRFCCLGTESNAANELIEVWYVSFLFFEGSHRKGWFAIICLGQNCAETSTGTWHARVEHCSSALLVISSLWTFRKYHRYYTLWLWITVRHGSHHHAINR